MDTKLTAKNIKDWVIALRSHKYKQGIGHLRSHDDKYCCLGVLATVCYPDKFVRDTTAYMFYHPDRASIYGVPRTWLDQNYQDILTGMNDTDYKSFNEIADWIEENIKVE